MNDKPFLAATFNDSDRYRLAILLALIIDSFLFLTILLLPSPWLPSLQKAYWPWLNIWLEASADSDKAIAPKAPDQLKATETTSSLASQTANLAALATDDGSSAAPKASVNHHNNLAELPTSPVPAKAIITNSLVNLLTNRPSQEPQASSLNSDSHFSDSPALEPAMVPTDGPVPEAPSSAFELQRLPTSPLGINDQALARPNVIGEAVSVSSKRIFPKLSPLDPIPLPDPKPLSEDRPYTTPWVDSLGTDSITKADRTLLEPTIALGLAGQPPNTAGLADTTGSLETKSGLPGLGAEASGLTLPSGGQQSGDAVGDSPHGSGVSGGGYSTALQDGPGGSGSGSHDSSIRDQQPTGQTRLAQPEGQIVVFYPFAARARNAEGRVEVKAVIEADGKVARVGIQLSSGDRDLDAAALAAVQATKFKPASRDNQPVQSEIIIPFSFKLLN